MFASSIDQPKRFMDALQTAIATSAPASVMKLSDAMPMIISVELSAYSAQRIGLNWRASQPS